MCEIMDVQIIIEVGETVQVPNRGHEVKLTSTLNLCMLHCNGYIKCKINELNIEHFCVAIF